jgi:acyl-CoA hydrolase
VQKLGAVEAAALVRPVDTLALPLGPTQPPRFLEALGKRTDWENLSVFGALLTVFTELFSHPNVNYLSGFFGPLERILRDTGANIGFAPADFRRFAPLLEALDVRVVATAASPPDADGYCSLSLHAGAHVNTFHAAGADPERLLVVEVSEAFPRTRGWGEHGHRLHVDEIDVLVESDATPYELIDPPATPVEHAIAHHISALIPDGATLQTGIGGVPSVVASILAAGDGGDYGVHSEMFTTGLMQLCQSGKVTNRNKGQFDGVSVTTFAAGTKELYEWLHENDQVAFLPVDIVNSPEIIGRNRSMIAINGALAIDIQGQVVADTRDGDQFSGIGGHEDFVAGAGSELDDRSVLCLPSTYTTKDGAVRSRIVGWFDAGAVITTPRHQVHTVVTEHGVAELVGKTVHQRGQALAAIAAPEFRDGLLEAAERASKGRSPMPRGKP